ncbi:STAS domain-containing protein [Acaryochloris marina]|uniref:Anti-sigma factor antagonist n=1 Tax=Acaryochloris marina (strain MBIC 11017) TaxID=329726 RepID=A8ZM46_ACAM1|nr:STAS domain-containing protein [Acaryochloris marina]ABW31815.1 anti-sigma factor antagonist [Acaryochloris marina MBIC11017]BDM82999.1 hypothetical protein AM10699_58600 [Acaryochloris marina MBIC10699]
MSYKIIQPTEFMDDSSANQIRYEISKAMANGVKTILVDLQEVAFINSSAIGALVATHKVVYEKGGTLSLCSLNEQVKIFFALTKMDHIFDIFIDRHEFMQKNGSATN